MKTTTRFIKQELITELINLYHLGRSYCQGNNYEGRLQACRWFIKEHPEYSQSAVYKDLDYLLS